ncbi:uncharacterized protein LAESUDRAFT_770461, partial [Laetiporus sulphureus 93-53]
LINLRVEGTQQTIFEGLVFTQGHNVTTALAGTLTATRQTTGRTPTRAQHARAHWMMQHAFWASPGTAHTGRNTMTSSSHASAARTTRSPRIIHPGRYFWTSNTPPVGGCQQEMEDGADILFAWADFYSTPFLSLSFNRSNATAYVVEVGAGENVTLLVTDDSTGDAISGAEAFQIDGGGNVTSMSDEEGRAILNFATMGLKTFKAWKEDAVRSNLSEPRIISEQAN